MKRKEVWSLEAFGGKSAETAGNARYGAPGFCDMIG